MADKECSHKNGTYLSMIGGLWGRGAQWCVDCGACISDSSQPPRPEGAKQHREFEQSCRKAAEHLDNMTPEERADFDEKLRKKLDEHRKNSPFRRVPYHSGW